MTDEELDALEDRLLREEAPPTEDMVFDLIDEVRRLLREGADLRSRAERAVLMEAALRVALLHLPADKAWARERIEEALR